MLNVVRRIVRIRGAVQGVGYRPFIYRTAMGLGLKGFVSNDTKGVEIEVEGTAGDVDRFLSVISSDAPPLARVYERDVAEAEPAGYSGFEIRTSSRNGDPEVVLIPDIASCDECFSELLDPADRRYRYPFINCTNCGPRFTIIERLPYDRQNTTMKDFPLCPECKHEYDDPMHRRFHAQPNACSLCGPAVWLADATGIRLAGTDRAISLLVDSIRRGKIAAVKGVGGFHIMCSAVDAPAVRLLRERKLRPEKPFAVMFRDVEQLERYAVISGTEREWISSPERPVILVQGREGVLQEVAPGLKRIGVFLAYSPLHLVILDRLDVPVIATSGNLAEEPIVKDNDEALERLGGIADLFLLHDRPIERRCDDSVVKLRDTVPIMIRRSRGYVPAPVRLPLKMKRKVLAVGVHEKNTFAIGFGDKIIMSQHIGDMASPESLDFFEESLASLSRVYEFTPDLIVHDLHPGYDTSRWAAARRGVERVAVQHHYAHILSVMAEWGIDGRVTGISWDGTGFGDDGTLWGGECFLCDTANYERKGKFRPFRLIGGEKAVREPRRIALSLLFDLFGAEEMPAECIDRTGFDEKEVSVLRTAWERGINSPWTSSAGRLFDGLASILGLLQVSTYEAQAPMMIEDLFDPHERDWYPWEFANGEIDWRPVFHAIIDDGRKEGIPSRFINTLAGIIVDMAVRNDQEDVCLSGGVFQNGPLCAVSERMLREKGFTVFMHRLVPPNDGGVSLGQAYYGGMK